MNKKIEKILLFILENIPIFLTVLFGAYVVLKNQQNKISTDDLLGWILGILCLLATSILFDRFTKLRRIEKNTQETFDILKDRGGNPSLDIILSTRKSLPTLEERFLHIKEVVITGGSLFRLSTEYLGLFEQKLKEGCKFKFLLLDPNCEAAQSVAENIVYEVSNYETYKHHIQTSLNNLEKLKEKFPDLIEIKTSKFVPSFSLMGLDISKPNGTIMIEMYTYLNPTRERPHFILHNSKEPYWYSFFSKQFNKIWLACAGTTRWNHL